MGKRLALYCIRFKCLFYNGERCMIGKCPKVGKCKGYEGDVDYVDA